MTEIDRAAALVKLAILDDALFAHSSENRLTHRKMAAAFLNHARDLLDRGKDPTSDLEAARIWLEDAGLI